MIPSPGCDPKINILVIGSEILKRLKNGHVTTENMLIEISNELGVSMDHVILTLDWLYSIHAIFLDRNELFINEVD
ncbi:ABC-three component system middle component 6 [Nitrosomonas supralitoralis]|uniref:Uncharacterized protein n=1 Tax=Nitrosomonas supralitoralis TaxID=2116706 RepID=A0A2P7NXG0_9PROT|nr:ABC-three component system middle component 6 [Nitrosomonas supralitoralis]PSJ18152.1 hypothetical protein C7H79_04700 [Nitrosomonas supralitoralis]